MELIIREQLPPNTQANRRHYLQKHAQPADLYTVHSGPLASFFHMPCNRLYSEAMFTVFKAYNPAKNSTVFLANHIVMVRLILLVVCVCLSVCSTLSVYNAGVL